MTHKPLTGMIAAYLLLMPLSAWAVNYYDRVIQKEGLEVKLSLDAVDASRSETPIAGQLLKLSISGKRLADQQPLKEWALGTWLDLEISPLSGSVPVCGQRVAGFLSGNLMRQPLLDLTGYYVLTLDQEASLSVLDPAVSFANKSSLYSVIKLGGIGFDWLKTADDARLFVALPDSREVVVIDLQTLQLIQRIKLPGQPTRLALMPGERLLWVGQTGLQPEDSQLSVIDTQDGRIVATRPLPKGHHEFAFSEQGLQAYVSNRDDGSVTLLDGRNFEAQKTWKVDGLPLSLAVTGQTLWVSDAQKGRLLRYNLQGDALDSMALKPGVGPIRLSPDRTQLFALNPGEHQLYVIDTQQSRLLHSLTISGRPYDVIFSDQFAYIRTLDSEQAALISLSELNKPGKLSPKYIPVGANKMSNSGDLPIASSMTPAMGESGAFFAAPAERTVYHYMEGMNAPDSGIRTYGHVPMATLLARRGLRQVNPGLYEATFRLPSAGRMVLALASENPRFMECIGLQVKADQSSIQSAGEKLGWVGETFLRKKADEAFTLRVKVTHAVPQNPALKALAVRVVPVAGGEGQMLPLIADTAQAGEYTASGRIQEVGSYYLHIISEPQVSAPFATLSIE